MNFTKFTEKQLCQSLYFNKVYYFTATLFKKRLWHRFFPVNFVKLLRTPFLQNTSRRLLPEMILGIGVLKIFSKFTGKHLCRGVISIKFLCYFIEITLRHRWSPANLLHIFRAPFLKNLFGGLLL